MDNSVEKKVKIIFVLIDGLSDVGYKQHDDRTPLQTANVPCMDALARSGNSRSLHVRDKTVLYQHRDQWTDGPSRDR